MHQSSTTPPAVATSDLALLWRARVPILAVTLLAGAVGWIAAQFIQPTYESQVELLVAKVLGKEIESPYAVAQRLTSISFAIAIGSECGGAHVASAEVVEGSPTAPDRTPVFIRIVTRGTSASATADCARRVVDRIVAEHKTMYDAALAQHTVYEKTLEEQIESEQKALAGLDSQTSTARGDQAAMVFLLQSQRVARQSRVMELAERLRDLRIQRANQTRPTQSLVAPTTPQEPVWPRKTLMVAVAAGTTFLLAVVVILLAPAVRTRI
jgi:uncharacterized protein involved in exopolysaccharide biosynthesis